MKVEKIMKKLFEKENLSFEEAQFLFEKILTGEVENNDVANILIALKLKGETSDEIAGAIKVLDLFKKRFPKNSVKTVDTCGTGGDGKKCFNISTAVAITVNAGGIPVTKHGNSAQSGFLGSADILEKFNIPVKMDLLEAKKYFSEKKFVFLYAPYFHPAMKNVAPVRKKLAVPTIFNFIGPFINPAEPEFQIIGVGKKEKLNDIVDAVKKLKRRNIVIYSSEDGYDEISSYAPTRCFEVNEEVGEFTINPEDFFEPFKMPVVKDENDAIEMFYNSISGEDDNLAKIVALNSAIIFYKMKDLKSIKEGFEYGYELIKSEKVLEKFNFLKMNEDRLLRAG